MTNTNIQPMSSEELLNHLKDAGPKRAAAQQKVDAAQAELESVDAMYGGQGGVFNQIHNVVGSDSFEVPGLKGEWRITAPRGIAARNGTGLYRLVKVEPKPKTSLLDRLAG